MIFCALDANLRVAALDLSIILDVFTCSAELTVVSGVVCGTVFAVDAIETIGEGLGAIQLNCDEVTLLGLYNVDEDPVILGDEDDDLGTSLRLR